MLITELLKKETAPLHRATERCLPTPAILNGTMDRCTYSHLLAAQYLIFQNLEEYITPQLLSYPSLHEYYVFKTPWLEEDLVAMGQSVPEQLDYLHMPQQQPFLMGMLYVMEGSMLGGQHILKGLGKNEELADLPHRFYRGYGEKTGGKWAAFKNLLIETTAEKDKPETVEGANYTFRFFQQQFMQWMPLVQQNAFQ